MLDFFNKFLRPPQPSGATAKERLRLVLLSDHLSLAPDVVEALKADLLGVISRYVEIDGAHADVTFEQRAGELAMLASVPITGVRRVPYAPPSTPPPAPAPVSPEPVSRASAVVTERTPAPEPQALELPMAAEPTAAAKASHAARRRRRRRKANAAAKRNAQQQGGVQQMNTTAQA